MALSPQYGWAEPDNSSLVKNGAADIRTLGDAIDTSLWNVGFGQAGKNKIINGDFAINQRNFTSNTANQAYNFDRWVQQNSNTGGSVTVTPQTFTAGAAPVAGYEGINFVRIATAGQTTQGQYALLEQRIEDVRTFANQTVTLSFWAKASTGTPYLWLEYNQNFGSGGSATVSGQMGATQTISTSWARYSVTVALPSITGKTIGTSSYLDMLIWTSVGSSIRGYANATFQNATIDIWGVQLEYGSKATPFETATGTIQGELAACQRYYFRSKVSGGYGYIGNTGNATNASTARTTISLPSSMRVYPTAIDYGGAITVSDGVNLQTPVSITLDAGSLSAPQVVGNFGSAVLTQYRYYSFQDSGAGTAFLGLSAEL